MPKGSYSHSPEHRRKASESMRRYFREDPRAEKHRQRLSEELLARVRLRGPEEIRKAIDACAAKNRGSHGFGRSQRGRLDHYSAKHWAFRSAEGAEHTCDNLREWCRANVHLFPGDVVPCGTPLWERAYIGISRQASSAGKPVFQWRGWRLVSVSELPGRAPEENLEHACAV